jgi:outer membrane lipoprotein-sorting protein
MKKFLLLPFFVLHLLSAQGIQTSEQLVKKMHERYEGKWYKSLTFVQKTSQVKPDTTIVSTWYECFSFPGKMRIDMDSTSGMLINGDSLYVFRGGKLTTTRLFTHTLLVLGFEIYFLQPQDAIAKLLGLHFDLSQFREDTWQGRPVYVVGAKAGDLHTVQFWIDKERLYFVRLLEPAGANGTQTRETQFNKYVRLGGGWLAPEVVFMVDNKVLMKEEYSDARANPNIDMKLFEPRFWSTTRWW